MPPSLKVTIPLVLKDRLILREGRWNGVFYPADEIKPLVSVLNDIVKAVKEAERAGRDIEAVKLRNATSLFWDHDERCENWLGDVRNFRWDDKVRGIRGDLYIVDREAASKLKFQEKRGWTSWGLSPSVMVDKTGDTARNVSFNNIAVVLEPAGGTKLMLSANGPMERPLGTGGRPMVKKKEKADLENDEKKDEKEEEKKEEKKDETTDTDEDKTKEEDSEDKGAEEDSTKEEEKPADADSEEEELSDIDFDSEEGSDDDSTEELAATTDDIMAGIEKLTKIVGALLVALKKGAGYGEKKEEEDQEEMSEALKSLDRDAMLDLASKIIKEAKALEGESELSETVLRDFLSRIMSFLPGSEKMASDGNDGDAAKEEDGDKKSEEKDDGEEEKEDAESAKDKEDSKSEKKEEMKAILKEGFTSIREDLKKEVKGIVKEALSLRVKPTRKGRINREAEELSRRQRAREDLQAKIKAEKDPEKRLQITLDAAFGVGEDE